MKIEIKKTKEPGWIQVTTLDERFYLRESDERVFPSSTWIAGYYPKGIQFYKWLAQKGWDESQAIKIAAGDKGSKIHQAIEDLERQGEIEMGYMYPNPTTGAQEELTVEEWEACMSFMDWRKSVNPEMVKCEQVVYNEEHNYAGTLDRIYRIDNQLWVVDFKSGQHIWTEAELQVSSYKHALPDPNSYKLAILQLGYKQNKRGWKWTEIEDKFDLFLHASAIWKHENPNTKPKQMSYPMKLSIKEK